MLQGRAAFQADSTLLLTVRFLNLTPVKLARAAFQADSDCFSLLVFICSVVLPCGSILSRGSGNSEDKVHTVTRGARLEKSSEVTPKLLVSKAPKVEPAKAPPLRMLIKVAKRVASTPCSQHLLSAAVA